MRTATTRICIVYGASRRGQCGDDGDSHQGPATPAAAGAGGGCEAAGREACGWAGWPGQPDFPSGWHTGSTQAPGPAADRSHPVHIRPQAPHCELGLGRLPCFCSPCQLFSVEVG